jgi:hypothetical protein
MKYRDENLHGGALPFKDYSAKKNPLFVNRYFTCENGHGGFVKPGNLEVLEEDGHLPEDEQIEEI